MRQYTVQPGDSPASIAAAHAGCPKCSRDLVAANPHKRTIVYPNGYVTFDEIVEGETLNLPDKWFSAEFDALPPAYFAALPSADGVTPPKSGVAGFLGNRTDLESAAAQIGALASMNDAEFASRVNGVADTLARAVADAPASQDAGLVRAAAALAKATQDELVAALATGDTAAGFEARSAMLRTLSDGLAAARRALESVPVSIAPVSAAANAAAAQLAALDPCAKANAAAVCAAQVALGLTPDGKYGDATSARMRAIFPASPAGCSPRPAWWAPAGVSNCPGAAAPVVQPPSSAQLPVASAEKEGISAGAVVGLVALGAGAIGTAIYLSTRPPKRSLGPSIRYDRPTQRPTRREST